MDTSQVISICQQLTQEGKKPSIALIKARLAGPKPLPLIIAGFKQWEANPSVKIETTESVVQEPEQVSLEQRVAQLEQEVAFLKKELSRLTEAN